MNPTTRILFLAAVALALPAAQDAKDKKEPGFTDKESGFSVMLPADKKKMAHWEITTPKADAEGQTPDYKVRVHGDYSRICDVVVFGQAYDGAGYDHKWHADQLESGLKRGGDFKKIKQRSTETLKTFTKDKVNASHVIFDAEGLDGTKAEMHAYCFRSPRNNWIYTVLVQVEAGYLDKPNKDKVPDQINEIITSFRTFPIKSK